LRPAHSRGHQFVTRYPKASDISSPPCLLRLLPAGANRRVGLAPTGKPRLVTAHPLSRHWRRAPATAQLGGYLPLAPGVSTVRSTDLQVRCHGSERDGRDVPIPDLADNRLDLPDTAERRACTWARYFPPGSARRRSTNSSSAICACSVSCCCVQTVGVALIFGIVMQSRNRQASRAQGYTIAPPRRVQTLPSLPRRCGLRLFPRFRVDSKGSRLVFCRALVPADRGHAQC
jgi:hypothetical protein